MRAFGLKLSLAVFFLLVSTLTAQAGREYPSELEEIAPAYPGGEIHMSRVDDKEINAAILAKGVSDMSVIFDFYKTELGQRDWKEDSFMQNPMMSVMHFVKDDKIFIVGLMDHKQPGNEGIMITLTYEIK